MGNRALRLKFIGGDWIGPAVSYALPLMAGATLGVSLVYLAVRPQWGDQTWLLFAARRVLDGASLGGDLVEVNAPLIVWLTGIPAAIGGALGIRLPAAMQGFVIVLVACSVAWSAILLCRGAPGARRFAGWFALSMLFATVVHPWVHYGQREHLMLLLVIPYLVMAAARIDGEAPSNGEALVAGLCAGIGFLLKPHHVFVVLAVEALVLVRSRDFRLMYRLEIAAMAATALGYVIAVWHWTPDYLLKVVPLAINTYYGYHRGALWDLILPMRGLKLVIVVLLWAVLYRRLAHRALATVLLLAGVGATIGYLVQLKGHEYHFVPAIAFFDLLFAVLVIDQWLQWTARRQLPISADLASVGAAVMFIAVIALCYPLQVARAVNNGYTDARVAVQRAVSQAIPRGATVLILSTSVGPVFEQVLDRGWKWGSRFDCLWMLPAIFNAELAADFDETIEPEAMRDAATLTRNAVSADLARWHPNPVLVDRCDDTSITPCMGIGSLRLDLLQWLRRDSGFAAAWADYVRAGQVGPYDLWCRKDEGGVCRDILASPLAEASVSPL